MTPGQVSDGRLATFEHLEVKADRFDQALLDSLLRECSRSVTRVGDDVVIALAYVQRRVTPLDVY